MQGKADRRISEGSNKIEWSITQQIKFSADRNIVIQRAEKNDLFLPQLKDSDCRRTLA